jgi:hypothetical protein
MTGDSQFLLLWKGRQTGPFSIEQIRERLFAGDINRMHQIQVDGRWQILDEYLEKLRGSDRDARRAEQQMREVETKRQFEAQSHDEHGNREGVRNPLSHLLPKEAPTAARHQPYDISHADQFGSGAPSPFPAPRSRMSGFAITAFVMGLCNFIPFVNFVSWILALVFGHISLSQMKADESLKGRGLAIAGLAITYFLLVVGITIIVLCLVNNKPLPFHF